MDSIDHTTFSVKREPDFSPGLGFQSYLDKSKDCNTALDMDFASFLGEPAVLSKYTGEYCIFFCVLFLVYGFTFSLTLCSRTVQCIYCSCYNNLFFLGCPQIYIYNI